MLNSQGWGRPGKTVAFISIYVGRVWGQAGLGQTLTPTGTHEIQDKVWVMPGYNTCQQELRMWQGHAMLGRSSCQHMGMDLVKELWGLPCWSAAPSGDCETQSCGQTRLGKAVAPASMCVD